MAKKSQFDITTSPEFRRVRDKLDGIRGPGITNGATAIAVNAPRARKNRRGGSTSASDSSIGTEQFQLHTMVVQNRAGWQDLEAHP